MSKRRSGQCHCEQLYKREYGCNRSSQIEHNLTRNDLIVPAIASVKINIESPPVNRLPIQNGFNCSPDNDIYTLLLKCNTLTTPGQVSSNKK